MDPDANLKEQLELAARIVSDWDEGRGIDVDPEDVQRLAELALALDSWIAGGGFLPAAWKR